MRTPSRFEMWYGRNEPPVETRIVRAGPVTAQLVGADLRYIRVGEVELVRRWYVALRDRTWRTPAPEYSDVAIDAADDHFSVRYTARVRRDEIDFTWTGTIVGGMDGSITYAIDGVAATEFLYNRIGFCVLHPVRECTGRPYRARTPGGPIEGTLPLYIGPQQLVDGTEAPLFPSTDRLEIDYDAGARVRFDFEGDLFEMEDQRNWTDDSFKTYSTPLALKYPHRIQPGQKIQQRVALSFDAPAPITTSPDQSPRITLGQPSNQPLPPIGLGLASHDLPLVPADAARLKALRISHLRVDLRLAQPTWPDALRRASAEARTLGCRLIVAIFLTDAAADELDQLARHLTGAPIERFLVFHEQEESTGGKWVRLARERLASHVPDATFAGGTNSYFTQINRTRPNIKSVDAVAYSINPQVHAFDDTSIVETLRAQTDTVTSARAFCGDRPIVVSSVTLKTRSSPNGSGPPPAALPGELPATVDPRQMSLVTAAWTVGSVRYLSTGGASAVTYFETTGWQGLFEPANGSTRPALFPSSPGMIFPVYHVFADLAEWNDGILIDSHSTVPLAVDVLAMRSRDQLHVLLANLTPAEQHCTIGGLGSGRFSIRYLDETTFMNAAFEPDRFRRTVDSLDVAAGQAAVRLLPYATVRIDGR